VANDLSAFVPQVWSRNLIANINQVNIAIPVMCNHDYEGEIRDAGDTVQVRTFGNITVGPYTRGTTIVSQSLTPVKETLVISDSQYFAFDVDSLDIAQNDINAIQGYTGRAGVSMSNAVDTFVMNKALAGVNAANKIGTPAAPIAITPDVAATAVYKQLVAAGLCLDKLNVSADSRWAIVTPFFKSLIMSSTTYFIRATDMGDAIIRSAGLSARDATRIGFIGQAAGFDVYMSNNLPTNATYWANLFGQGLPVCYAAQIPPGTLEVLRLETTFATRVRGLLLEGAQVFAEDSKRLGVIYTTNA
jgi:hypothetical protein